MRLVAGDGTIHNLLDDTSRLKIDIIEIADTLANMNRYGGRCGQYSVAQHSVLVHDLVPKPHRFAALMHDAHEAICTDLPTPLKETLDHIGDGIWTKFESKFASAIRRYFHLPIGLHPEVKLADYQAFLIEIANFSSDSAKQAYVGQGHLPDYSRPMERMSPRQAFDAFLQRYSELGPNYI